MDAGAPTYPVGTIAKLLLLTERRVQQLTKEGIIPKSERGRYELAPAVQGYVRYLQARTHGSNAAPADYHFEKARLVRAQADRAEAELAELNASLVGADDVADAWANLLTNMKTRLLSIPTKSAASVLHEETVNGIQSVLESDINEVLMEFVGYGDKGDENTFVEDVSSGTTAEAES